MYIFRRYGGKYDDPTKSFIIELSEFMVLTPEQLSIKSAMLISAIFPLAGLLLMVYMKKNTPYESKN